MRLVIVCSDSLASAYLASALSARHDCFIVAETQSAWGALRRVMGRKGSWLKKIDRLLFFAWYVIALARGVKRRLEKELGSAPRLIAQLTTPDLNGPDVIQSVLAFKPDAVVVFGVGILRREWLSLQVPALNVHSGLLPRYRGRFCWLWPWVEGNPAGFGVTIHELAAKVDTGKTWLSRAIPLNRVAEPWRIDCLLAAVTSATRELLEELPGSLMKPRVPSALAASVPEGTHLFEPGLTDFARFLVATLPFRGSARAVKGWARASRIDA